jgi:hypothetical protein
MTTSAPPRMVRPRSYHAGASSWSRITAALRGAQLRGADLRRRLPGQHPTQHHPQRRVGGVGGERLGGAVPLRVPLPSDDDYVRVGLLERGDGRRRLAAPPQRRLARQRGGRPQQHRQVVPRALERGVARQRLDEAALAVVRRVWVADWRRFAAP